MRALGSEYVGVRYRNRYDGVEESPPWRIIGAVDGTTLTWDPAPPSGAPTTLSLGQVAQFDANGPFVVRSQDASHPFYVSAHMTGAAQFDPSQQRPPNGDADGRGDAEFVNVIPPGEYLAVVRVLHRSDLPRDQPRHRAHEGLERLRRRHARLRRHAQRLAAGRHLGQATSTRASIW